VTYYTVTKTPRTPRGATGNRLDHRPTAKKILDVAAELFYQKGYANASVQDVADVVGILKGSLYYYIDSKDDLLARLIENIQTENLEMLDEIAAIPDLTPLDRLRLYVERQVLFNTRNVKGITVYYRDLDRLPAARRNRIVEERKRFETFVMDLVRAAQERGEIADGVDARVLTYCTYGTTNWLYTWYRPRGPISAEDLAAEFAEFVIAGMTGSRPRRHPNSLAAGPDSAAGR
jgi:TetR/AcrR family transcriptional regulator, cholesterol catabolism regulator